MPLAGWKEGCYRVVAVSPQAYLEWVLFTNRCPKAAQKTFERLSSDPLAYRPRTQFPLRGRAFYPFWELEVSAKDRIWYAVDEIGRITIVAARDDVLSPAAVAEMLRARRGVYEAAVAEVLRVSIRDEVEAPLRVPDWAFQSK